MRRFAKKKRAFGLAKAAKVLYKPAIPAHRVDPCPGQTRSGFAEYCMTERITMAVPKRKTTRMKRGFRRSADALKQPTYVEDKDSGELRRPHHVDLKTGMYRGRQILSPKDDV
ncbi:hypothetical protein GCM10007285_29470 [Stappia taiwanensis]|nr:hypothetical protein GCM10007285_29470 [Stappia taiwanensis]